MLPESEVPGAYATSNPGLVVLLVDMSGSMIEEWRNGRPKIHVQADYINRCLEQLVENSTVRSVRKEREEGLRATGHVDLPYLRRVYVKLVGYRKKNDVSSVLVQYASGWPKAIWGQQLPGNHADPKWLPVDDVDGDTPTGDAFWELGELFGNDPQFDELIKAFKKSFPPLVLHVTDGKTNVGRPLGEGIAHFKKRFEPLSKTPYIFHVQIAPEGKQVLFPCDLSELANDAGVIDPYAAELFAQSDPIPDAFKARAELEFPQINWGEQRQGLIINASPESFLKLLDWGLQTRVYRAQNP